LLDGNLDELGRLAGEAERFCRERSLSAEVQFDIDLALEELFINAVRHGGCEGMKEAVQVRLEAAADEVRVEFRDRGVPFDPTTAPPPDLTRIGGLGIHLVRELMRDFRYQRTGEWNRITMRRPL
jgi:anti-sigma regulatory factor (Ser/Thr protein kinase)